MPLTVVLNTFNGGQYPKKNGQNTWNDVLGRLDIYDKMMVIEVLYKKLIRNSIISIILHC